MQIDLKNKRFLQLFLDLFLLGSIFFIFLKIKYSIYGYSQIGEYPTFFILVKAHYKALILFCFSWYIISVRTKLYNINQYDSDVYVIRRCLYQVFLFSIVVFAVSGLKSDNLFSIKLSLCFLSCILIVILILRFVFLFFIRAKANHRKVIFIDENENTEDFFRAFVKKHSIREIKKFVKNPDSDNKDEVLYDLSEVTEYIETNSIKVIFLSLSGKLANQIETLLNNYKYREDIQIVFIPDHNYDLWGHKFDIKFYNNVFPILLLDNSPYIFGKYSKRFFDLCFSFLAFIFLLSWIIPLFSILIKLTSKGPVFYLQERVGFNGKSFKIIKFRSMYTDAEKHGPRLSSDNDSRITSVGKIMRKYRIDELPQFINVIKGNMSIVGPRPERKFFVDKICEISPRYKELHTVKPGITSLGQVYFGYAETLHEMSIRLKYDLLYLNHENFLFDIKIIWLTIVVVFKGKGK